MFFRFAFLDAACGESHSPVQTETREVFPNSSSHAPVGTAAGGNRQKASSKKVNPLCVLALDSWSCSTFGNSFPKVVATTLLVS